MLAVSIRIKVALILLTTFSIVGFIIVKNKQQVKPAPVEVVKEVQATSTVRSIGRSVKGRDIVAHTYGTGKTHIMFVGGIHGGYEWNSVLLAYTFIDYLESNPQIIPKNLTISIVPSMNPDALYVVTQKEGRFQAKDVTTDEEILTSARFNANSVDLNRNFDCNWQPKSTWRSKTVSAGTSVLSEPEAQAIKNFIIEGKPSAVVFWHSQSNAVYASACNDGILPATRELMNLYAKASGYPAVPTFDAYKVTGAVEDWLASIGIPAITVELKTHETIDWEQNLAGSKALIEYYSK